MNVHEIGQLAFTAVKQRLKNTCDRLSGGENKRGGRILGLKRALEKAADLDERMARYERAYIPLLANKIKGMANPEPITLKTLPESIVDRYMSKEGANLVTIYPALDILPEGKLDLFKRAVEKASDRVTGTIILTGRLVSLIGEKGLLACGLALGAVFLILLIDFRNVGYALLGLTPLMTGFTWMVGIFVLMDRKYDVSNVTGLPLILGIGIDDAVHMLHAVRRRGSHALADVLRRTGRALMLTSLTTGIAFSTIALSSHRGMAGMGVLLVLGVASCFITSVVLLPALMRVFLKEKST